MPTPTTMAKTNNPFQNPSLHNQPKKIVLKMITTCTSRAAEVCLNHSQQPTTTAAAATAAANRATPSRTPSRLGHSLCHHPATLNNPLLTPTLHSSSTSNINNRCTCRLFSSNRLCNSNKPCNNNNKPYSN